MPEDVAAVYRRFAERRRGALRALRRVGARRGGRPRAAGALLGAAARQAPAEPAVLRGEAAVRNAGGLRGAARLRAEHRDEVRHGAGAAHADERAGALRDAAAGLARLPQPLALLEVGASAGLCLLSTATPTTTAATGHAGSGSAPSRPCSRAGPRRRRRSRARLDVVWRAGLDLAPVDVERRRSGALARGARVAGRGRARATAARGAGRGPRRPAARGRRRPAADLPALAAEAPPTRRSSCSTPRCSPTSPTRPTAARSPTRCARSAPSGSPTRRRTCSPIPGDEPWPRGQFLLTRDGKPVAWTDPHGTAIDWPTRLRPWSRSNACATLPGLPEVPAAQPRLAGVVHPRQEDVRDVPRQPSRRRPPGAVVRRTAGHAGRARRRRARALLRAALRRPSRLDRRAAQPRAGLERDRRRHRGRLRRRRAEEGSSRRPGAPGRVDRDLPARRGCPDASTPRARRDVWAA